MISTYILLILVILSFTLNPYLKKHASNNVTTNEFLVIYNILVIIGLLCYLTYLLYVKQDCTLACFKKLNRNELMMVIIAVITGMLGSILLLYLIKMDEVSFLIPNIQGIVILISAIIGYFVFKETVDVFKAVGIIFIFFGIVSLNYGKLKKN
tara:strand:+ start:440 stop:898 length:459 start_codon:yes stop_codon:yes gene_type:complete